MTRTPLILALIVGVSALASCDETNEPDQPSIPKPTLATTTATQTLPFYQMSAGHDHTCGVTTDNRAYCWGDNSEGQLGDGTTTGRLTPVAVAGGIRFRQISAGFTTSCGLTTEYRVYCWGYNALGEVGDGSTTRRRLTPVPIAAGRRFVQVVTNFEHSCGVSYTERRAYCWGSNSEGELGDGTRISRTRPVAVSGSLTLHEVSLGYDHTCGMTTNKLVYCWGNNSSGQIGDSVRIARRLIPTRAGGARRFLNVSAGGSHTCAVTTEYRAVCWGGGRHGEIGNGKAFDTFSPRSVAGGLYFTRVTAGLFHSCGETRTNQAYCWGENSFGQLGDGSQTRRLTPVPVMGGLSFAQVSAGAFHTCGRTPAAGPYCWGINGFGELGDGSTVNRPRPVRVAGGS